MLEKEIYDALESLAVAQALPHLCLPGGGTSGFLNIKFKKSDNSIWI